MDDTTIDTHKDDHVHDQQPLNHSLEHLHQNEPEIEPEKTDTNEKSPVHEVEDLSIYIPLERIAEESLELLTDTNVDYKHNTSVENNWDPLENVSQITEIPMSEALSDISILTRITQIIEDDLDHTLPICLLLANESNSQIFEDNKFNFPPNVDPGIAPYMNQVETDTFHGWERYKRECWKYSMPRLTPFKDLLELKTTELNLRVKYLLYFESIDE